MALQTGFVQMSGQLTADTSYDEQHNYRGPSLTPPSDTSSIGSTPNFSSNSTFGSVKMEPCDTMQNYQVPMMIGSSESAFAPLLPSIEPLQAATAPVVPYMAPVEGALFNNMVLQALNTQTQLVPDMMGGLNYLLKLANDISQGNLLLPADVQAQNMAPIGAPPAEKHDDDANRYDSKQCPDVDKYYGEDSSNDVENVAPENDVTDVKDAPRFRTSRSRRGVAKSRAQKLADEEGESIRRSGRGHKPMRRFSPSKVLIEKKNRGVVKEEPIDTGYEKKQTSAKKKQAAEIADDDEMHDEVEEEDEEEEEEAGSDSDVPMDEDTESESSDEYDSSEDEYCPRADGPKRRYSMLKRNGRSAPPAKRRRYSDRHEDDFSTPKNKAKKRAVKSEHPAGNYHRTHNSIFTPDLAEPGRLTVDGKIEHADRELDGFKFSSNFTRSKNDHADHGLVRKLILAVRKYPVVWDQRLVNHANPHFAIRAWKLIMAELKPHTNFSLRRLKQIWKNKKDYFIAATQAGTIKTNWKYINEMQFYKPCINYRMRNTVTNEGIHEIAGKFMYNKRKFSCDVDDADNVKTFFLLTFHEVCGRFAASHQGHEEDIMKKTIDINVAGVQDVVKQCRAETYKEFRGKRR